MKKRRVCIVSRSQNADDCGRERDGERSFQMAERNTLVIDYHVIQSITLVVTTLELD